MKQPNPMWSPAEIQAQLDRILINVQKPGRYVGGELNQRVKAWEQIKTHVALVFPDIYDIGLPNLGLAILYDQINNRADALAERAYSPWLDMEAMHRQHNLPLYTLESKHPLAEFDIIGFTLPYETLYTNVLNILDLAGLPLTSAERDDSMPLVIAGGHAAFNPEPMADFIDAYVIGEGEEIIHEIIDLHQAWQDEKAPRLALLERLSQVAGIYVPGLYAVDYEADGRVNQIRKRYPQVALPVIKRIVPKLPPPPTRFIVPSIDVVHNRIAVEIMRGCTRGCRFCHAGMINRPVRERPVAEVVAAIQAAVDATGFEEVGLLSLSSSDYTHINDLVDAVSERFTGQHLSISLPSLRIESFSVELMDRLKEIHPGGGFTLAPEAATEKMRNIINKPVSTDQLLDTARAVFEHGWSSLKLYFMIGLPYETLDDVQAIADLCKRVFAEGRRLIGGRVKLHVGVGTFIPKPHTPFQWVACEATAQIEEKLSLLKYELRHPNIKVSWSHPEDSLLEAWLARGDRRTGQVILKAWQLGARFDAWQEQYRHQVWLDAFQASGIDPAFYSHRQRAVDETFPWDHISPGVRKSYLLQEYEWSQQGRTREDCREQCYACGILPVFSELRIANPGEGWKCPEVMVKP